MAKIRIKIAQNEIEIDSRDFYVDNESVGQIITEISQYLTENSPAKLQSPPPPQAATVSPSLSSPSPSHLLERKTTKYNNNNTSFGLAADHLKSLDDAEVHEPEFANPVLVTGNIIKSKLEILEKNAFFDKPRTVSDTVGQLYEYGWIVSPLEVSKILTKMALYRKLTKDLQNERSYYSVQKSLLTN